MSYFCPRCGTRHDTTACPQQSGGLHQCSVCGQQVGANGHACGGTPTFPPEIPYIGDVLKYKALYEQTLLQIEELKKELAIQQRREAMADTLALANKKMDEQDRLNVTLQNSLDKMLKMYPASTFCDVDCEEGSCEHCTLEREVKEPLKRIDLGCICKDGNGFAENGCPCPIHKDI